MADTNKPTGNFPEWLTPEYIRDFNENKEAERAERLKAMGGDLLSKYRAALPQHTPQVNDTIRSLEYAMYWYLGRPNSDPQIVGMVQELLRKLGDALSLGNPHEKLGPELLEDAKAALVGATMALDHARGQPETKSVEYARLAKRFLELSKKRIGKLNPDGSAEVRVVVDENQYNWTTKIPRE